jgi:UDP-N-acetylmuramate dehydrogenase
MGFGYRTSKLDGGVVLGATFALQPADPQATLDRFRRIWHEKAESQPAVSARSAGCIFKNPPGQAAGALLDQAGLKRRRCGGAEVSPKHANFIVAHPGATAQNVLDLIALAREAVRKRTGIVLELEVEIW